jgi:hypothetical protein
MKRKRLNAMPALLKFLVLLALFLSASNANAFTSLSSVAGNQVRVNHLTRLQQPISNSTNEPSRELIRKPTKQMDLNAVLPNNLSSKKTRLAYSEPNQDAELPSKITYSTGCSYSVIFFHFCKDCGIFCEGVKDEQHEQEINDNRLIVRIIGLNGHNGLVGCIVQNGFINRNNLFNQNGLIGRIDLADRDLKFDETCSAFQMVACEHQFLNGKCNAFQMIAYLDFIRFPQNSVEADLDFRDLQRQLFNNIKPDSVFSDFQRQRFVNIKADSNFSQFLSLILHQTWRDHQHLISFVSNWDSRWSANVI